MNKLSRNLYKFFSLSVLLLIGFSSCKTSEAIPEVSTSEEVAVEDSVVDSGIAPAYKPTRQRDFDLIHTKLDVRFDWVNQHLLGKATLQLKPLFFPQDYLLLDAKGMEIKDVMLIDGVAQDELIFEYDGEQLLIELDRTYQRSDLLTISLDYISKPNERQSKVGVAITDDRGLYFINPLKTDSLKPRQIWTQGETESNSVWFPTIDAPNERCTQEIFITVDTSFQSLSNGLLRSSAVHEDGTRTDHWVMDKPHAPYLFMMAVGDFAVVRERQNGIEYSYWVEEEFKNDADAIFGNTPEMVKYFEKLLGVKYPWQKYAQIAVRDYVSGAMENTTASVFMEEVQVDKRALLDSNWDYIIAHELIHQWFGDLVTCESWAHLALNEGFANYGEYLWNEYKYGQDEADFWVTQEMETYLAEAEDKQRPLIYPYYEDADDMFDAHSYSKAGLILNMLRVYVGDDAFFESLNHYLEVNRFRSVEAEHLRLAFEEVTGQDLNWFFTQWFYSAGHPILDVSHEYVNDTLTVTFEQVQELQNTPLFEIPIFLDIYTDDQLERIPIRLTNPIEVYSFHQPEPPRFLIADGEHQLVGEIFHEKTPLELQYQYYWGGRYQARMEALTGLSASPNDSLTQLTFADALSDPFYRIRQMAIDFYLNSEAMAAQPIIEQIYKLIEDTSSAVRASAITYLGMQDFGQYEADILRGLQDSAYSVVGASLEQLYEHDVILFKQHYTVFKDATNVNVMLPLAEYYSEQGDADALDWFIDKSIRLRTSELFYLLQYFNLFVLTAPVQDKVIASKIYKQLAESHANYMVRFAAFQGLIFMSDVEGMPQYIDKLIENEKDSRLITLYDQFGADL